MNMPLSRPEWQRDCLLVAIKELVAYYQLSPSACLALQISRNYRLLITQDDGLSIKTLWQSYAKSWWDVYCRHRNLKQRTAFSFS